MRDGETTQHVTAYTRSDSRSLLRVMGRIMSWIRIAVPDRRNDQEVRRDGREQFVIEALMGTTTRRVKP